MATAGDNPDLSIRVMEQDLSCNVCYNLLREPKELDCPHIFCLQCLQEWVKKEPVIECPECRHITVVPQEGLAGLKTNLRLKSMVEKCGDGVEKLSSDSVPTCQNHKGEKKHFFCITCGVAVCRDCLVLQHPVSSHKVKELTDVVATWKAEMKQKVEQERKKLEDDDKILADMEETLEAGREVAEESVKKQLQVIVSEAEAKAKDMIADIQSKCQLQMETLKEKRHHTSDMITHLNNVRSSFQAVADTATDHVYVKRHTSLFDRMNKLCITVNQHGMPSPNLATLDFQPGSGAITLPSFGKVVGYNENMYELKLVHEFGTFQQAQDIVQTKTGVLAVVDPPADEVSIYDKECKQQFSLGVSTTNPEEKVTRPFSVAITAENEFLVAQKGHVIKMFSQSGSYKKTLTDAGDRLATTPDGMMLTGSSSRKFLSIHRSDGRLIQKHKLDCETISGIATNGKHIALTTGKAGNSVHAIDFETGQEVWKRTLAIPRAICYERNSNTLLVSSGETLGHFKIGQYCSMTGNLLAYLALGLYNPLAITVSQDGKKILVADVKTVKVYNVLDC